MHVPRGGTVIAAGRDGVPGAERRVTCSACRPATGAPVRVALDVTRDGLRKVLGRWFAGNEGTRFRHAMMRARKNRSTQGLLTAVVDGLECMIHDHSTCRFCCDRRRGHMKTACLFSEVSEHRFRVVL